MYCHTLSLHDALPIEVRYREIGLAIAQPVARPDAQPVGQRNADQDLVGRQRRAIAAVAQRERAIQRIGGVDPFQLGEHGERRSEEHTSELQSLMRTSYAVFCLNKKKIK